MRSFTAAILAFVFTYTLPAQSSQGEKALEKVLEVLTLAQPEISEEPDKDLQKGAWEALSYLNKKEDTASYTTNDLLEAVPDYYNFLENRVLIKLINQENYNEYGMEANIAYAVNNGVIELYDNKGILKDSWKILYLDSNYLALDMGDIRLFFTHTPPQE